jgi:hypothetical protein
MGASPCSRLSVSADRSFDDNRRAVHCVMQLTPSP